MDPGGGTVDGQWTAIEHFRETGSHLQHKAAQNRLWHQNVRVYSADPKHAQNVQQQLSLMTGSIKPEPRLQTVHSPALWEWEEGRLSLVSEEEQRKHNAEDTRQQEPF